MKYIVTGGAGFIGSHIVEELARHHEVVIVDNLFSGKMENISPFLAQENIRFVKGSITDLPFLKATFDGADGVFHEGAIASVPRSIADPVATNEANVSGTLNVLIAARDCRSPEGCFCLIFFRLREHPDSSEARGYDSLSSLPVCRIKTDR